MDCPDDETFAEYLEGGLPPEHRDRFEEHLDACQDCRDAFTNAVVCIFEKDQARRAMEMPWYRFDRLFRGSMRLIVDSRSIPF